MPTLKPGDCVEIIAPASRGSDEVLNQLKILLESWKLRCIIDKDIFGNDLLCANTDEKRFTSLKKALYHPETKAIICVRGGYGSMRLIPELSKQPPPSSPKLFVGMSDVTALHLFLEQQWAWPSVHGSLAQDKFSNESIQLVRSILFGTVDSIELPATALNPHAKQNKTIEGILTGGNLSLVQASLGTSWHIEGKNKIIFLEEVGERAYRIDRMLNHVAQAKVFNETAALIFGDFLKGNEPNGSSLVRPILERFAQSCSFPVVRIEGIGHGYTNVPMLLGTTARLNLGNNASCTQIRVRHANEHAY